MTSFLRPDEQAALSSQERVQGRNQKLKSGFNLAASAGSAFVGGGLAARLYPFFSEFISPELAIKGISKISPQFGDVLKKGMEKGLDVKEGLDFLKGKIEESQSTKSQGPIDQRNILEQYSPELFSFIKERISQKGETPAQAAIQAYTQQPKFRKIIEQIEKDHKVAIHSIAESIFGGGPGKAALQGQPAPQQQGQGSQALMQAMQNMQAVLQQRAGR